MDKSVDDSTPWYKKVWVKVIALISLLGIIFGVFADGFDTFDRLMSKEEPPIIKLIPKECEYDIDGVPYSRVEELELYIQTANFTGTIDDSIKIIKVTCLSDRYEKQEERFTLTKYELKNVEISHEVLNNLNNSSKIILTVDFSLFFNLNYEYFVRNNGPHHVYDVLIEIPFTTNSKTSIETETVPIYVSK